jgi:hypothetical protein
MLKIIDTTQKIVYYLLCGEDMVLLFKNKQKTRCKPL